MTHLHSETEKYRLVQLKKEIESAFDHLAEDEIAILANEYDESITRMIEVTNVKSKSAIVMDLFEDIEYKPVIFPEAVLYLLNRHDVFLVTMGLKNKKWIIIYMSAPYN